MLTKGIVLSTVILASATSALASENPYLSLENSGLVVDGMIPHKIILANHQTKIIRLMSIALSTDATKKIANRLTNILQNPYRPGLLRLQDLPAAKYIAMNGEDVLDQGQWGTCATFASTGAVNAMFPLSSDSKVSQLCNLEVGRTLENGGDGGWEGSFGFIVLGQISQYGYIDLQYQTQVGCGGLKVYPTNDYNSGTSMPLADFTAHSSLSFVSSDWTPIVSYDGNFSPIDPTQANTALTVVKNAINQGYRVVFGSLIDPNVGQVGAAGTYDNIDNDTWVMTTQMQQDILNGNSMEGHEIIIDGYDDNACATYMDGTDAKQQCGLLRIRNSWSAQAGDQGDYYMSYDHFKGMVIEAYAIGQDVKDKFKPLGN